MNLINSFPVVRSFTRTQVFHPTVIFCLLRNFECLKNGNCELNYSSTFPVCPIWCRSFSSNNKEAQRGYKEIQKKINLTNVQINDSSFYDSDEETEDVIISSGSSYTEGREDKWNTNKTSKVSIDGVQSKTNESVQIREVLHSISAEYNKSFIIPKETKTNIVNEEILKLEHSLRPSAKDINNTKTFISFLQEELNKHYTNCYVTPFGSVVNGFWIKNSDIDICIQVPVLLNRKDQIKFLKKVSVLLSSYKGGIIELRFSAKVPIVHFYFKNPSNDFELSCDISVNNILAIINSKLIQTYVSIDKRLQLMGIAVKYWSKKRHINDRSKGFLSSFSLILMIIHFLQNVTRPRILPSLQDIAIERNEKPNYVLGVDCKFCTNEKVIREELNRINNHTSSSSDVASLMLEFFKFYGYEYKSGVIAIRDINNYYQNFHALREFESFFLFVDNPFEVGKDVANVTSQNYKTIIYEMKRAYKILKSGGSWHDVIN